MNSGREVSRKVFWAAALFAASIAVIPCAFAQSTLNAAAANSASKPSVQPAGKRSTRVDSASSPKEVQLSTLYRLPISFEENTGQADARVKFMSRGKGYALALTEEEAILALAKKPASENPHSSTVKQATLRMRFEGSAERAKFDGIEPLHGKVYYVTDYSQKGPLSGNRTFRAVRRTEVYPGINAVFHGKNDRLQFDFEVAPHADPKRIRLAFTGADKIALTDSGDLSLKIAGEEIRLQRPFIFQEQDGKRREISGGFQLHDESAVGFALGEYNPSLPLVIDPTIQFATYIGSGEMDSVVALETDATGAIYILGSLGDVVSGGAAISFPFWQTFSDFFTGAGVSGCYLAKLRSNGNQGVDYDFVALMPQLGCDAMGIAPSGDVSIAGSAGIPLQTVVQTFKSDGGGLNRSQLFYIPVQSTRQLRVDTSGNIYALGLCSQETNPGNFYPLPGGFQDSPATGLCDDLNAIGGTNSQSLIIVTDAAGQITYGTFLGDGSSPFDATAMQIDTAGKVYIAGQTDSGLNLVTADAFQSQPGDTNCSTNCSPGDAFVVVINPAQTGSASLTYSSYFGGTSSERDISMAVDASGKVYLAGNTDSRLSFPGVPLNDNAIFLSVLDLTQSDPLLSSVGVVQGPLTTLLPWLEAGPALRLMDNGWVALMASSVDSSFPLVNPLFSGPYNPNAPNPIRPLLLVYDPINSTFPLATYLDDPQLARFPHIASFGANNLYLAMVTSEASRSTDGSPTFGQDDVLLFGLNDVSGAGGNQPPTVFIPFFTSSLYADSPTGANLNLTAIASDPEGGPLTYSWSGPFTNSPVTTNESLAARLALGAQQTVTLTVTDDHGNSASASITVDIVPTSCSTGSATPIDSTTNAGIFNYAPLTFTAAAITSGTCNAFLNTHLDQNPPIPSNLQGGSPPIYFDVSNDGASLATPINVCINTRGMSFPNPASIRLYHYRQSGQLVFWDDITLAGYPQGDQLCGQANSLGTFAIFYPQVPETAIETIAGNGIRVGSVDGPGGDTSDDFVPGPALSTPLGYLGTGAYDRTHNFLYFTELGGYIRKLDLNTNVVTTVAGNGIQILGLLDGPGGDPRDDLVDGGNPFNTFIGQPVELAIDSAGDVYFFDRYTCRIRRLDVTQNLVFNFAGNGNCAFSGDGFGALQAALSAGNMAFDASDNLFLADSANARVRRIDRATNIISTVAGDGSFGIPVNGPAVSGVGPVRALAFDRQGHLLLSNGTDLLRVSSGASDNLIDGDSDEILTVINGCHTNCQVPFGGDGLAITDPQVFLAQVQYINVAQDGALLLSDGFRIRRISPGADSVVTGNGDEIINTVASYFDFRPNPPANFNGDTFATQSYLGPFPTPMEDNQGRILVVDNNNYRIRRFGLAAGPANPSSADVSINVNVTPDPADTDALVRYFVIVTNNGPATATSVTMTYAVPGDAHFDSVNGGPVSCTAPTMGSSGTVTCDFGTMASGAAQGIEIFVKPQSLGQFASSFGVAAAEPDANRANNSTTSTITVNLATAVIEVTENIAVSDTPAVLPSAMIGVSENIVVTDTPNILPSAMIGVNENIVVTDTPVVIAPDAIPPVLSLPGNLVVEATGPSGALVIYIATANDAHDGPVSVICSPASGSAFMLGITSINCSATDAAGNTASGSFTVTVQDRTSPVLTLPGNITVAASGVNGANVNFTATATDLVSGALTPACVPTSGTLFPVGTTSVACSAIDGSGNSATGSFAVTVNVGAPSLTGIIAAKGRDLAGNFFVDLQLTNSGTGHARNITLTALAFRTLTGTGTVTYNAAISGPLPRAIGSVDAGSARTIRLYLNVPLTVRRFSIAESGSLQNVVGASSGFSLAHSVIP